MIAFVLSGGGNRGPLEVGALQALFERGLWPDFLVGTSAGAINAAWVAASGSRDCLPGLAAAWRQASKESVYAGNLLTMGFRILAGADSLFDGDGMRRLVRQNLPPQAITFADLKLPCYLTAVDLRSSRLYLFGEDPAAPLVDAIVASCSIPGIHPPVQYHGLQLVDGGVVAATPCSVAMDMGATTIYAINVGHGEERRPPVRGVLDIIGRTLDTFVVQSLLQDLAYADQDPGIDLYHIQISAFPGISFNDFSHIDEMIAAGRAAAHQCLDNPRVRAPARSGGPLSRPQRSARAAGLHRVPGARQYIPPPAATAPDMGLLQAPNQPPAPPTGSRAAPS